MMIAVLSAVVAIPQVYAAHEGAVQTPYPKANCISGAINGACDVAEIELANGTMFVFQIDNSFLHRDNPVPQPQTETQTQSVSNDDEGDDSGDEDSTSGSEDNSCYDSGFRAGQNGPFSQPTYDHCGDEEGGDDAYYNGFISGCMKADNSRETCESATDAD